MSSNQEDRDQDGVIVGTGTQNNRSLIRTGIFVAAILIAILYSRSCFAVPPAAAPAEVAQVVEIDAPFISNFAISGDSAEFSGSGEPGETVEVFIGGNRVGQTTVGNNGQWSFVAAGLGAGIYEAVASHQGRAFDQSNRISFTVDEAESAIELIKPVFGDGLSESDFGVGDDLVLTGVGTPNIPHVLYVNGVEVFATNADANGAWQFVLPDAPEGEYTMRVVAMTDEGDQLASDDLSILVSAPVVEVEPEETEPEEVAPDYSIALGDVVVGDNSDAPVMISGTGTPGNSFGVYIDDLLVHSGVIGADGTWSFSGILPAGPHNISARLFANDSGDVSGDSVATADGTEIEVAEARTAGTVNSGRNGLLRVLFGGQVAEAGAGDDGEGSDSDGDADGDASIALAGAPAVELIVDASWSMTFPLDSNAEEDRLTADDPDSRIAIAQAAMVDLIENTLPEGVPVAVRAFGNIEGNLSCRTDLMAPLQPLDRESLATTVAGINPQFNANTAIAAALSQVSNDLADTDREKIVVLLTDGQETCGGDPAAIIEQLAAEGTRVSLNVIGFAILDDELKAQFAQWAELGNGEFYDASDADLLSTALEGAMTISYVVTDVDGVFVASGIVGGQFIDLEPGVYNISTSGGDVIYENIVITPGSISALPGG